MSEVITLPAGKPIYGLSNVLRFRTSLVGTIDESHPLSEGVEKSIVTSVVSHRLGTNIFVTQNSIYVVRSWLSLESWTDACAQFKDISQG